MHRPLTAPAKPTDGIRASQFGDASEDEHKEMDMPRKLTWLVLFCATGIFSQAVRAETWQATAGAQSHDMGRQVMAFLPSEMWIHAGDSITWTFVSNESHTVTFLSPNQIRPAIGTGCPGFAPDGSATFDGSTCLTSAASVPGQTFTVTFPVAGNFKLVCLAHKDMTATIHVLSLATALPYSQAAYNEQAEAERENLFSSMDADGDHDGDHGDHPSHHQHLAVNQVIAGTGVGSATAGGHENLAVFRFLSDETVIHAGETVEWVNLDPAATHTITFGTEPANLVPASKNVTTDADGARHAAINSITDSVHSGSIASAPQERTGLAQAPLGVTRFRVTFTQPGTYPYICALHDQLGMKGKVIVLP